ncbi:MAG: hypothetical protein F6K09_06950 [Merismopedia sp. SIO2A8]|nr:hypothetical protein [Merismopedia sp. SIO2A8]
MTPDQLDHCFSLDRQQEYVALLMGRVGLTRRRAECFVRLWAYLWLKQRFKKQIHQGIGVETSNLQPVQNLGVPDGVVSCTCREAALLFYPEGDRGSERSAGMMLDKLAALGLIKKTFDGNTLAIAINPLPELHSQTDGIEEIEVFADAFDPRCDVIPVANVLAQNYNWMNRNADAVPYRISRILRQWADQYTTGMRVLRRRDNLNPVGFYVFYPTKPESEVLFFGSPNNGLHLSVASDLDPFEMATPGDLTCRAIFIRSWVINPAYRQQALPILLKDAQQTLTTMQQDFPSICDLHTLIIHPGYEELIQQLGFQKMGMESSSSVYWVYLAMDRFLAINVDQLFT